jgi:hypothetical protein
MCGFARRQMPVAKRAMMAMVSIEQAQERRPRSRTIL